MVENLSLLNDNVESWNKVILFSISNYMFQAYQGCERQNQDSAPGRPPSEPDSLCRSRRRFRGGRRFRRFFAKL